MRRALPNLLLLLAACSAPRVDAPLPPPGTPARVWVGPETWANRLQDWRVAGGRIECVDVRLPVRTLHRTTRRVAEGPGDVAVEVRVTPLGDAPDEAFAGVLVGAGAPELDWRAAALVQMAPGPGGGWLAGVRGDGRVFVRDFADPAAEPVLSADAVAPGAVRLRVEVLDGAADTTVSARALDATGALLAHAEAVDVPRAATAGSIALACDGAPHAFDDWTIGGTRVTAHPERTVGSLIGAQHTLSRGVLKLTAQLLPVASTDGREVALEVREEGRWRELARAPIVTPGWTAHLRVPDWPDRRDVPYRLVHAHADGRSELTGTVRRDPVDRPELVLAALSCNHNNRFGFGRPGYPWSDRALWFPHADLVEKLRAQAPDLLFFAGDQLYEGASPTRAEKRVEPELDYLYKWALWHLAFGELTRELPTVTLPDDHDVYQGNLWGAGGVPAERDNEGGYVMPAEWVRMVERTQTWHLPDPFDPTPVAQGIGVYYTHLAYGGVSFAVLEDRKFKSGCADLGLGGPRPDHITDPAVDPARADRADKVLLGERQLGFLEAWTRDWDGVVMKAALSQSPFANLATHHGARQDFLRADLDSNGWPQSGRDRALAALRRAFAPQIAGDQHLATLVHHGIDDWDDATWSFTAPAIANFYARSFRPEGAPEVALPGGGPYTGSRRDGFGNRVTVHAVANPGEPTGLEPPALWDQVPGYGLVRFRKATRETVVECWPRHADPAADGQFPGWPRTLTQRSCYGRAAYRELAPVASPGLAEPVVELLDGRGALVYALRATPGFRPFVFAPGRYTLRVERADGGFQERALEIP